MLHATPSGGRIRAVDGYSAPFVGHGVITAAAARLPGLLDRARRNLDAFQPQRAALTDHEPVTPRRRDRDANLRAIGREFGARLGGGPRRQPTTHPVRVGAGIAGEWSP